MHLLTAFSLKNRALIALVTIVAAVFGFIGVGSLKQELMPSVQFPTIAVVTSYPGASPEVVSNDVSGPIETALKSVPQLESTTATSSTGSSVVMAQFDYGIDLSVTEQRVERAISRISQMLPENVDTQVVSGSVDDFPVIQVAVTPASGESIEEAAKTIERVAIPELSDLDGVREAQLTGALGERVTIEPDLVTLSTRGLSTQSVADALQQSGVLVAAGTVGDGDRTLAVQAGSELTTPEEIASIPLARSAEELAAQQAMLQDPAAGPLQLPGKDPALAEPQPLLTIGDVAEVRLEANPQRSISRVDGEPALTIAVTKVSAANTVEVSHAVQRALDDLQDQIDGAKLTIVFDQAPYVEQSIETLTTEGLLGLVFAVLVILVFLMSVRATLVTAISIPTSVLLAFVGLNFADYTLNMLTLGALTISIGRVVDDSIVVIENIKRHLGDGSDRVRTIVRAVREVAGAITASTVTTVAVFLPMAFVGDMVGELFRPFAFTVTIALIASLLVSLTIVPVLAFWFLRPEGGGSPAARRGGASDGGRGDRAVELLQRGYRPVIEWTLGRPIVTLIAAVLVLGITGAMYPLMKQNYMGSDEQNSVGLTQTLAPGTSLDAQLAQAERVEGVLRELTDVESVQVTIGGGGDGMAALFGSGDGSVSYAITTDPDADQAETQDDIRTAVDGLDDAGEFSLGQSSGGVAMSSAIEVYVTAPDQDTLAEAADAVTAELQQQDGLVQVENDLAASRPYLSVRVDRAAAAEAGLSEAAVAGMVAQKMQPRQIGQITIEDSTVGVYLSEGVAPEDQAGVAALGIPTPLGERRLDSLATVEVADGPVTVRTEDGVRMVTVSALPAGDDLVTAGSAVRSALESAPLPGGANAEIGGVMSQQEDAFAQLGLALLAAILIVYVVMVATFRSLLQPLLLLVSVPFAATGAILLLIATGIPLGVASLIGVLMLVGIVVTNAIVLIDLVNQFRERGDGLREAVLHGSMQRLRPIVMTALATILALTPMALGITGKGGFISQPLAVVVIGGLLSSTVLTLVVLPTLYYAVEGLRGRGRSSRRRRGSANGSPRGPRAASAGGGAHVEAAVGAGTAASGAPLIAPALAVSGDEPPPRSFRRRRGAVPGSGEGAAAVPSADESPAAGLGSDGGSAAVPGSGEGPAEATGIETGAETGSSERAAATADASNTERAADAAVSELDPEPLRLPDPPADAGVLEDATVEVVFDDEESPAEHDLAGHAAVADADSGAGVAAGPDTDAGAGAPGAHAATPAHGAHDAAADVAAQNALLAELMRAGLSAPETSRREMGPATAEMSLALSSLGFTGEHDPLREDDAPGDDEESEEAQGNETPNEELEGARGATARGSADTDSEPDPPADPEAEPETEAESEPPAKPEPEPETESEPEPETDPDPAAENPTDPAAEENPAPAPAAAPPVTGELDWEQLMWQATQEVDEELGNDVSGDQREGE